MLEHVFSKPAGTKISFTERRTTLAPAGHAGTLSNYRRFLSSTAMTWAADETCAPNGNFCSVVCSAGIDTLELRMKLYETMH